MCYALLTTRVARGFHPISNRTRFAIMSVFTLIALGTFSMSASTEVAMVITKMLYDVSINVVGAVVGGA